MNTAGTEKFLHEHGGHLTRVAEPVRSGYSVSVTGVALIPKTTSLWGFGHVTSTAENIPTAAIYKYGP
jgi:hypothetical protein